MTTTPTGHIPPSGRRSWWLVRARGGRYLKNRGVPGDYRIPPKVPSPTCLIASQSHPPAKIPGPWPAVRDLGALKRGSCVLEDLPGVRVRGPGPWSAGSTPCPGTLMLRPPSPTRRPLVAASWPKIRLNGSQLLLQGPCTTAQSPEPIKPKPPLPD